MASVLFGFHGGLLPLPAGVWRVSRPEDLAGREWQVLALTREGCVQLSDAGVRCQCSTLLVPGDAAEQALRWVTAERVADAGLAGRNTLTVSSLREGAVLCLQRQLLRPDGGTAEPQELPLPALPRPPEEALLLWGVELLLG